jgi:hypothetical protein
METSMTRVEYVRFTANATGCRRESPPCITNEANVHSELLQVKSSTSHHYVSLYFTRENRRLASLPKAIVHSEMLQVKSTTLHK